MSSANNTYLQGYAGFVETRTVASGDTVTKFLLKFFKGRGDKRRSCGIRVEAWNVNESVLTHIQKAGVQVAVQGSLDEDNWTDKATDKKINRPKIVADQVFIVSKAFVNKTEQSNTQQQPEVEIEADVPF